MKNNQLLLLVLLILGYVLLISCDKNSVESMIETEKSQMDILKEGVSVTTINSAKILKFDNEESFQRVLEYLNKSEIEDRLKFTRSFDVKTQTDYLFEAMYKIAKLEEIQDLDLLKEKFNDLKIYFQDVLMFNTIEDDDFIPYSRIKNFEIEPIANINGEYLIGNDIKQSDFYSSFDELYNGMLIGRSEKYEQSLSTRGEHEGQSDLSSINVAWSRTGDRYASVQLSRTGDRIYMRLNCQKKTWLGWFTYSTIFNLRFVFTNYPQSLFLFNESAYNGNPVEVYTNPQGNPLRLTTRELSNGFSTELGKVEVTFPSVFRADGTMEVWSRGIEEANRGFGSISFP